MATATDDAEGDGDGGEEGKRPRERVYLGRPGPALVEYQLPGAGLAWASRGPHVGFYFFIGARQFLYVEKV